MLLNACRHNRLVLATKGVCNVSRASFSLRPHKKLDESISSTASKRGKYATDIISESSKQKTTKYMKFGTSQRFDIVLKCKFLRPTDVHTYEDEDAYVADVGSNVVDAHHKLHKGDKDSALQALINCHIRPNSLQSDMASHSADLKVFVNNLPPTITHEQLARALRNCGIISTISLYNLETAPIVQPQLLQASSSSNHQSNKGITLQDGNIAAGNTDYGSIDEELETETTQQIHDVVDDFLLLHDPNSNTDNAKLASRHPKHQQQRFGNSYSSSKNVIAVKNSKNTAVLDPDSIDESQQILRNADEEGEEDDDHSNDDVDEEEDEEDAEQLSSSVIVAKKSKHKKKSQKVLKSRRSDTCGFVVLKDAVSYDNINREAIRLFGISIGGQACKVQPASTFRTVYLDMSGSRVTVEHILSELKLVLGDALDVSLAYPVKELSCTVFVQLDFDCHEHASVAYTVLNSHFTSNRNGRDGSMGGDVQVALQWNRTQRYWELFSMSRDQISNVRESIRRKASSQELKQGPKDNNKTDSSNTQ